MAESSFVRDPRVAADSGVPDGAAGRPAPGGGGGPLPDDGCAGGAPAPEVGAGGGAAAPEVGAAAYAALVAFWAGTDGVESSGETGADERADGSGAGEAPPAGSVGTGVPHRPQKRIAEASDSPHREQVSTPHPS